MDDLQTLRAPSPVSQALTVLTPVVLAIALVAAWPRPATSIEAGIVLLPHRAVYDLALDTRREAKGINGAKSRIAFDFGGNACEGYSLSFRQVTSLDASEGARRVIDTRTVSLEKPDGGVFSFTNENRVQGGPKDISEGAARRQGAGYAVKLVKPEPTSFDLASDVMFPTAQLKAVIRAARAGESTLNVPMFDGAEDGQQIYDTLTVIGRRIEGGPNAALEPVLRKPEFDNMPRWPVTTSYFKRKSDDITPAYRVSYELFDNGVTRALKLDYNDFILSGDLTAFDLLPAKACSP
jgi:EipB-like